MADRSDEAQVRIATQIREAFAGMRYPGTDRLVPATSFRDPEREQIIADFAGRDWRELRVPFIREQAEALLLMSPSAFRFYLPAYAVAAIEDPYGSELAPAVVVKSLTPPADSGESLRWFEERVGGLSTEQIAAMRNALSFIGDAGLALGREVRRALQYWDSRQGPAQD